MARLSPEERAKLRAVAEGYTHYVVGPGLPELRQAQRCKVAISVLFHVLRVWKPVWEHAAPEQYTKICKWLAVVATAFARHAIARRREVEYALQKMERRLRPYLRKADSLSADLPALCSHGSLALRLPDNGYPGHSHDG